MANERILLVEDDPLVVKMLSTALGKQGYEVIGVTQASEGLAALKWQEKLPEVVILDLNFLNDPVSETSDSFGLLHSFCAYKSGNNFQVIIYTSDTSPTVEQEAEVCGVFAVIRKDEPPAKLLEAIRRALAERKTT